ncbi:MAG: hypothetical protein KBC56_08570 [Flavobacterium sp.]|nr:hypothetical protein [Flavobacterium sp.]
MIKQNFEYIIFRKIKLEMVLLFFSFCFLGCKTQINQTKNNLQEGKWIVVDTFDYPYISKGKYHKGKPVGSWKYFYNGKLDRKERYKKNSCLTKFYYPNGQIKQQGYTQTESNNNKMHWYYTGNWNYFDSNGKLTRVNVFEKGKIIDSIMNVSENKNR